MPPFAKPRKGHIGRASETLVARDVELGVQPVNKRETEITALLKHLQNLRIGNSGSNFAGKPTGNTPDVYPRRDYVEQRSERIHLDERRND